MNIINRQITNKLLSWSMFFVFLGSGVTVEAVTLETIVRKGQRSPDGNGKFSDFHCPAINDAGQVAFWAKLTDTRAGNKDNQGIFRVRDGKVTRIVRKGQQPPEGNGRFLDLSCPLLNSAGQVAFRAKLAGTRGKNKDNIGIYRGGGGALTQIARKGQRSPDGNGRLSDLSGPVLNDAGQVAFWAKLTGTSGGSKDNEGVYRGRSATLTQIMREGQMPVPDDIEYYEDAYISDPALNSSGQVAFSIFRKVSPSLGVG